MNACISSEDYLHFILYGILTMTVGKDEGNERREITKITMDGEEGGKASVETANC